MSTPSTAAPIPFFPQGKKSHTDPLTDIHLILGARLRVTMTDGRVARGTFVGLDRLCNIILDNVIEHRDIAYIAPNQSSPSGGGDVSGGDDGNDEVSHSHSIAEKGKIDRQMAESEECNDYGNHPQILYRWSTERSLTQAVVRGDSLAKVEIIREEWAKRTGRYTVSKAT